MKRYPDREKENERRQRNGKPNREIPETEEQRTDHQGESTIEGVEEVLARLEETETRENEDRENRNFENMEYAVTFEQAEEVSQKYTEMIGEGGEFSVEEIHEELDKLETRFEYLKVQQSGPISTFKTVDQGSIPEIETELFLAQALIYLSGAENIQRLSTLAEEDTISQTGEEEYVEETLGLIGESEEGNRYRSTSLGDKVYEVLVEHIK